MLDFAEQLLVSFVEEYGTLYGKEQVSYNMHGLIHFVDDCQKFGVLNNFSTFYFEKSFQIFKRKFKKNHQTLARMRNRELEQRHLNSTPIIQMNYPKLIKKIDKNFLIPGVEGIQFKKVKTATFCLSIMDGDNSCIHKDGRILVFESIIDIESKIVLICSEFLNISDLYDYPVPSNNIGIYLYNYESEYKIIHLNDIALYYFQNIF